MSEKDPIPVQKHTREEVPQTDWYKPENMRAGLARNIKRLDEQRIIMHASDPRSWEYGTACTGIAGAKRMINSYQHYLRLHDESVATDDSPASK